MNLKLLLRQKRKDTSPLVLRITKKFYCWCKVSVTWIIYFSMILSHVFRSVMTTCERFSRTQVIFFLIGYLTKIFYGAWIPRRIQLNQKRRVLWYDTKYSNTWWYYGRAYQRAFDVFSQSHKLRIKLQSRGHRRKVIKIDQKPFCRKVYSYCYYWKDMTEIRKPHSKIPSVIGVFPVHWHLLSLPLLVRLRFRLSSSIPSYRASF